MTQVKVSHEARSPQIRNRDEAELLPPRSTPLTTLPTHPLRVQPLGNAFISSVNLKVNAGSFSFLEEKVLVHLLGYLDDCSLVSIGQSCKALYAFSRFEEIWKYLFLSSPPESFTWNGSWRSTYLKIPKHRQSRISCRGLFSDVLHLLHQCAYTPLEQYTQHIPPCNDIPRLSDLSAEDFAQSWVNKPFILTQEVTQWRVYQDWSTEALLEKYGDVVFQAEAAAWPLKTYVEYMRDNVDDSPLYLFDESFTEKMGIRVGSEPDTQYRIPECFGEDIFSILGSTRPDHRWLIVGPARSGSTFHKDPNATSAWNAVLSGSKYWIMFPPSSTADAPPGVFVSEDEAEVTTPQCIAEWLMNFHEEARMLPGCLEGICEAGEVLHVPSGWWHLVVNLSPTIAITQNFVPRAQLRHALHFLENKPSQVSGFKEGLGNPYALFVEKLKEHYPDLLDSVLQDIEQGKVGKKRKWEDLVKNDHDHDVNAPDGNRDSGFGFGFGDDDNEDIP